MKMTSMQNKPLWSPTEDKVKSTSMYDFMKYISEKYALQLNKLVGCRSYSRVDFLMEPNSNVFVLEINTLPGLTNTSLFPKAASKIGMSYRDIINKIVDLST